MSRGCFASLSVAMVLAAPVSSRLVVGTRVAFTLTLDIDEAILRTLGPQRLVSLLRSVKELPIPSSRSFQGLNASAAIKFGTVMLGIGLVGQHPHSRLTLLLWLG